MTTSAWDLTAAYIIQPFTPLAATADQTPTIVQKLQKIIILSSGRLLEQAVHACRLLAEAANI